MSSLPEAIPPQPSAVRSSAGAVLLVLALFGGAYLYAPYAQSGPVLCPLHGLVGLPCPGCGMTRAFVALAHGQFPAAVAYNALSLPLAAGLLVYALVSVVAAIRARPVTWPRWLFSTRLAFLLGGGVIAYHIARCIRWYGDGTLLNGYVKTSWTYGHLFR